jgi:hypothetical protein
MANELNALLNPDNVPGAVSTGYQRQNNNIFAIQTGLDTLNPIENGTSIIIEAGGIIEVNGLMFKVSYTTTFNRPGNDTPFYIAATDNGDGTASLSIVTTRGTWNNSKQGYYLPNGSRTTNKNIKNPSTTGGILAYSKTTKGKDNINLIEGTYRAVAVSGKGGGNGSGLAGGVANTVNTVETIFNHDGRNPLQISVGGNGYNGGNGGNNYYNNGNGYGGGSGAGEETEIIGICTAWRVAAGRSGSGQGENTAGKGGLGHSPEGNDGMDGYNSFYGGYGGGGNGGSTINNSSDGGGGGGSGGGGGGGGGEYGRAGRGGDSQYASNGGVGGYGGYYDGSGGGAGGAPGWQRPDGDSNAGSVNIYRL